MVRNFFLIYSIKIKMARVKQRNPKKTPAMFQRTQLVKRRPMMKTTRKGAYKAGRKKQMVIRRAPMVETKSLDTLTQITRMGLVADGQVEGIRNTLLPYELQNVTAFNLLPIFPYYKNQHGLNEGEVIGSSIFSKYLKCKLEFELPSGQNLIRHPAEVYLIHGWITQPIGATAHTTPSDKNMTPGFFMNHIDDQVQQYFTSRFDKLQILPKSTSNLKIEGYRKLKVKERSNLGVNTGQFESGLNDMLYGAKPLINLECNWKCMKKIHLTKGQDVTVVGPGGQTTEFRYPNNSWIPFVLVYSPTHTTFRDNGAGGVYPPGVEPKIKVRYNTIHYYSDS